MQLQKPTKQLVEYYVLEFEKRFGKSENAIRLLCEKFPDNRSYESVLLKSTIINALYSTQIRAIVLVAEHILALDIDEDIRHGEPDVVDRIARVTISGKQRNNYSFATKYCSFHNPSAYPIYDSFVDGLLASYQKQDDFSRFNSAELKNYQRFKQVLNDFREFYGLTDVSFKELDIFLWLYGKEWFGQLSGNPVR